MNGRENYQAAISYALLATLMAAVMNALIKYLGEGVDAFCLIFVRNIFTFVTLLPFMHWQNQKPKLNREEFLRHAPRAAIGLASNICLVYALRYLPLASGNAISLSQPLFVVFLAPILLKEYFDMKRMALAILGFAGVLLILHPSLSMDWHAAAICALHPLLYALATINLRYLSRYAYPLVIIFYYSLYSAAATSPWAVMHFGQILAHWKILLLLGLISSIFQYCQVKTLELAEASAITPFNYLLLAWSIFIAIGFWHEWPDVQAWVGMTLIVSMGLILNFMARTKKIEV